jgi:hypothetical protein
MINILACRRTWWTRWPLKPEMMGSIPVQATNLDKYVSDDTILIITIVVCYTLYNIVELVVTYLQSTQETVEIPEEDLDIDKEVLETLDKLRYCNPNCPVCAGVVKSVTPTDDH